jgi:hypothetical protein
VHNRISQREVIKVPRLAEEQEEPEEEEEEEQAAEEAELELEPSDQLESSLEELLARRVEVPEEDADPLLEPTAEERVEGLTVRAAPRQPNEFVCSNCHLVKGNSQLADRKRQLCLDCV